MVYSLLVTLFVFASPGHAQQPAALDNLVVHLEQVRLLNATGIQPLPGGFAGYFFDKAMPFMAENKVTPRQLEEGLRKWNTGMHLLAVPKKFAGEAKINGHLICAVPMFPGGSRDHWIFLSGSGPAKAKQHRESFEIESIEENLKKLETVGMLGVCDAT